MPTTNIHLAKAGNNNANPLEWWDPFALAFWDTFGETGLTPLANNHNKPKAVSAGESWWSIRETRNESYKLLSTSAQDLPGLMDQSIIEDQKIQQNFTFGDALWTLTGWSLNEKRNNPFRWASRLLGNAVRLVTEFPLAITAYYLKAGIFRVFGDNDWTQGAATVIDFPLTLVRLVTSPENVWKEADAKSKYLGYAARAASFLMLGAITVATLGLAAPYTAPLATQAFATIAPGLTGGVIVPFGAAIKSGLASIGLNTSISSFAIGCAATIAPVYMAARTTLHAMHAKFNETFNNSWLRTVRKKIMSRASSDASGSSLTTSRNSDRKTINHPYDVLGNLTTSDDSSLDSDANNTTVVDSYVQKSFRGSSPDSPEILSFLETFRELRSDVTEACPFSRAIDNYPELKWMYTNGCIYDNGKVNDETADILLSTIIQKIKETYSQLDGWISHIKDTELLGKSPCEQLFDVLILLEKTRSKEPNFPFLGYTAEDTNKLLKLIGKSSSDTDSTWKRKISSCWDYDDTTSRTLALKYTHFSADELSSFKAFLEKKTAPKPLEDAISDANSKATRFIELADVKLTEAKALIKSATAKPTLSPAEETKVDSSLSTHGELLAGPLAMNSSQDKKSTQDIRSEISKTMSDFSEIRYIQDPLRRESQMTRDVVLSEEISTTIAADLQDATLFVCEAESLEKACEDLIKITAGIEVMKSKSSTESTFTFTYDIDDLSTSERVYSSSNEQDSSLGSSEYSAMIMK